MRRTETLTIPMAGRDQGKMFTIQEMSAVQAEAWFTRAVMLLARSGLEVPPDIMDRGAMAFVAITAGLALAGLSKTNYDDVQPLLSEMMDCVCYHPPAAPAMEFRGPSMFNEIEEVATILYLREKVISLHVGFSLGGYISYFMEEGAMKLANSSPSTPTSPEASPSSSQVN